MEIRNIVTFVKATEMQSFTKTAAQLGYSQAAVTVQIKQLEDELGTQLFDRIGRSVKLTHSGEKFMPYALRLLKSVEEAASFMKEDDEPSGTLGVGASSSFSAGILPGILPGFHEKYPKVDVVIKTSDMLTSTFDLLRQNELDFIFTLERKLISADFVSVAERKEDIVFVTNPDNPLAAMKNVPLERVVRDNFITSDRGVSYGLYMEEALAERGISYHPSLEIGSTSAIINMICQGKGVSFLPKFLADDPINHGALAIIDTEKLEMQMWTQLIRLKNKWMNPVMKAFVDYLRENFHQLT